MTNILASLGFGTEREQWNKLVKFIKNPSQFFKRNSEDHKSLMNFTAFIIRAYLVLDFILNLFTKEETIGISIFTLIVGLLLAKIPGFIALVIGGLFIHLPAKLFSKKSNFISAERIVAYTGAFMVFSSISYIYYITIPLSLILQIIGISKQYKISKTNSFVVILIPYIIFLLLILLIAYSYDPGIFSS